MKKTILFLFLFISILSAQDSLYLVNTLIGKAQNRLTSAKAAGDINGDGYADLVVSFEDSIYIYLGNPDFELEPDYSFSNGVYFYGSFLNTGDVNNDGYTDYIILDGPNRLKLHYGGQKLDTTGFLIYESKYYNQIYSDRVDLIGDVNGDGYNDFAISSPYNWDNGISYVFFYLGGDSISNEPFVTFEHSPWIDPNSEAGFGHAISGIGDVNEDGYDDILISDPIYADTVGAVNSGRVYLYYGGSEMDSIADSILIENKELNFGNNIKRVLIKKNDNISVAITSLDKIHFYNLTDELFSINGKKFGLGGYVSIGLGGDINGDGYNDFLIGNTNYRNKAGTMVGGAFLYYGNSENDTLYDCKIEGEHKWDEFSKVQDIIGDFNGDGYDDFFIIAPSYPDYKNPKGKLYLYSYKKYMSIGNLNNKIIRRFELLQNYPNPFNPSTTIQYKINKPGFVQLKIYDINGKLIKTLVKKGQNSGVYKVVWDAKNDMGINVSTGLYFYRLSFNKKVVSKKMLLIR